MFIETITTKIKESLNDFDEKNMHDQMFKHYKLMRLIDSNGKWIIPELQEISLELLPDNIGTNESKKFIDEISFLATKNPYLVNFSEKLKNKKLEYLSKKIKEDGNQLFPDMIAYFIVLDRLTKVLYDNPRILEACVKIFKKERRKINLSDWWITLNRESLFRNAKLLFIEGPFIEKTFLKSYKNGSVAKNAGRLTLFLNIGEAILADIFEGKLNNAKVGWILAKNKVGSKKQNIKTGQGPSFLSNDKKTVCFQPPLPKEWADLYQTWNMAFVAQSKSFPYLISKLLIPQVADYQNDPSKFLHKRVIALYLCLNYFNFVDVEKIKTKETQLSWKDEELISFWGKINLESAQKYKEELSKKTLKHFLFF
jgi:hypothetical protein